MCIEPKRETLHNTQAPAAQQFKIVMDKLQPTDRTNEEMQNIIQATHITVMAFAKMVWLMLNVFVVQGAHQVSGRGRRAAYLLFANTANRGGFGH